MVAQTLVCELFCKSARYTIRSRPPPARHRSLFRSADAPPAAASRHLQPVVLSEPSFVSLRSLPLEQRFTTKLRLFSASVLACICASQITSRSWSLLFHLPPASPQSSASSHSSVQSVLTTFSSTERRPSRQLRLVFRPTAQWQRWRTCRRSRRLVGTRT